MVTPTRAEYRGKLFFAVTYGSPVFSFFKKSTTLCQHAVIIFLSRAVGANHMTHDVIGHMIVTVINNTLIDVIYFVAFLLCFVLFVTFKFLAVVILKTWGSSSHMLANRSSVLPCKGEQIHWLVTVN